MASSWIHVSVIFGILISNTQSTEKKCNTITGENCNTITADITINNIEDLKEIPLPRGFVVPYPPPPAFRPFPLPHPPVTIPAPVQIPLPIPNPPQFSITNIIPKQPYFPRLLPPPILVQRPVIPVIPKPPVFTPILPVPFFPRLRPPQAHQNHHKRRPVKPEKSATSKPQPKLEPEKPQYHQRIILGPCAPKCTKNCNPEKVSPWDTLLIDITKKFRGVVNSAYGNEETTTEPTTDEPVTDNNVTGTKLCVQGIIAERVMPNVVKNDNTKVFMNPIAPYHVYPNGK